MGIMKKLIENHEKTQVMATTAIIISILAIGIVFIAVVKHAG